MPRARELTYKQLEAIPPNECFAKGVVQDDTYFFNFTGKRRMLRWVAVKGHVNDWVVYVHYEYDSWETVQREGDKIASEQNIRYLVPCTDEVYARYRH